MVQNCLLPPIWLLRSPLCALCCCCNAPSIFSATVFGMLLMLRSSWKAMRFHAPPPMPQFSAVSLVDNNIIFTSRRTENKQKRLSETSISIGICDRKLGARPTCYRRKGLLNFVRNCRRAAQLIAELLVFGPEKPGFVCSN